MFACLAKIKFGLSLITYSDLIALLRTRMGKRKNHTLFTEVTDMNIATTFSRLALGVVLASVAVAASARDLGPDEALKLRDSGKVQSFEKLNEIALAQHPEAKIHETELEEEWGRYVYKLELVDAQGQEWDVELNAATGEILKNRIDN